MSRVKFSPPQQADYHEQIFIKTIETYQSIKKDSLGQIIYAVYDLTDSKYRTIRKMVERYNNGKYEDITPLGKIVTVDDRWELVRSNHELADSVRNKARYNFLCGIIDYQNTLKALGDTQANGQLDLFGTSGKTIKELMNEAEELLNNVAK